MDKREVYGIIDAAGEELAALSDRIWGYAELAFRETRSAGALADALEREGFQVERGIAGIETAFLGRYGSGRPVIGILGEFDALSGLSQKGWHRRTGGAGARRGRSRLRTQYVRRRQSGGGHRRQAVSGEHRPQRHGGVLRHPR